MKNLKQLLPVLLLAILLLSACTAVNNAQPDTSASVGDSGSLTEVKDKQFLTEAYNQSSLATCDLIQNKDILAECKSNVEGLMLLQDAKDQSKQELCDKIQVGDLKQNCEIYFTERKEQSEKLKQDQEKREQERDKAQTIIKNNNKNDCKNLASPYDVICSDTIIDNQALAKNDATICEQHGDEAVIAQCKELVKLNQETPSS